MDYSEAMERTYLNIQIWVSVSILNPSVSSVSQDVKYINTLILFIYYKIKTTFTCFTIPLGIIKSS